MKMYETVIDQRRCSVKYATSEKELNELIQKNGYILEIELFTNQNELLNFHQFENIFKDKEPEIFKEIEFILKNDIYKNVTFNRYISSHSGINPIQRDLYGNTETYADNMSFSYTPN